MGVVTICRSRPWKIRVPIITGGFKSPVLRRMPGGYSRENLEGGIAGKQCVCLNPIECPTRELDWPIRMHPRILDRCLPPSRALRSLPHCDRNSKLLRQPSSFSRLSGYIAGADTKTPIPPSAAPPTGDTVAPSRFCACASPSDTATVGVGYSSAADAIAEGSVRTSEFSRSDSIPLPHTYLNSGATTRSFPLSIKP